jgi:hypothetical protein
MLACTLEVVNIDKKLPIHMTLVISTPRTIQGVAQRSELTYPVNSVLIAPPNSWELTESHLGL